MFEDGRKITELPNLAKSNVSPSVLLTGILGGIDYNAYGRDLFGGMPKSSITKIVAASDTPNATSRADYECDGTADDVEIQAAIDALPATGGMVRLLEGTYHISATIELGDDTVFEGVGDATILSLDDAVDAMVIWNKNATAGVRHGTGNYRITVRDFQVDGNKDNQVADVGGTVMCVAFSTVENLWIENLLVINGWTAAIRTEFCTNVLIRGNKVYNSADDAIAINEETFHAVVQGNICIDSGSGKNYGSPAGIEIQDGSIDVTVTGNVCKGCLTDGIQVSIHDGFDGPKKVSIVGNVCDGNTEMGIRLSADPLGLTPSESIVVTGNQCSENGIAGIYADKDMDFVQITGNYCSENVDGITVEADYAVVSGNACFANTQFGIYTGLFSTCCTVNGNGCWANDIGIEADGNWNIYTGNYCAHAAGFGVDQRYGLHFATESDYSNAFGNQFRDHTVANLFDEGDNNQEWMNIGANDGTIKAYSVANVTDPPTDAEIDAIFGLPTTFGQGFMGLINDNDADTKFWLCVSMSTFWLYEELTKAV